MPPLSQKKSETGIQANPAWHPNLRIAGKLPDTKVIRTAFFINGVAVTLALVMALWCGVQEWQIHSKGEEIAQYDQQIQRDQAPSDAAVALFNRFTAEESKLNEVAAFTQSRPVASDLIIRIGQTLPKKIALDSFDLREGGIILRSTVRGSPDKASGDASAYETQLRKDKFLSNYFGEIHITNLSRNSSTGRLSLEIYLEFKKLGGKSA